MSRIENTIKNIKYSLIGQFFGLAANFITRMVFVRVLNAEYLGLNGLFTNVLSILSFAELGIGSAIVYSMYTPLAENNVELLKGLMRLYKKTYITIGAIILVAGSLLTPFLGVFIKEVPEVNNLELIYLLYVVNTASSYFFSYKRSLLIADQKKYIEAFYHYLYTLVRCVLQIIFLLVTRNFIAYLIIQVIITFLENLTISRKVDELYPHIKIDKESQLSKSEKRKILRNAKAMMFHKVGNVAVNGTDNLLIAKFVGLVEVGLYSNYLLITTALKQVFDVVFQSMIASIGNLGVTESSQKNEFIFRCIDLLGLWLYGYASIALITLFNPFVNLWLGEEYLFPIDIVLLIVANFYLFGRRKSVLTFRDALGLFWYDRYKPLLEAIINLLVSIVLGSLIGLKGILIGTIISTLTTSYWVEPFVLYKYGFKLPSSLYFLRYTFTAGVTFFIGIITYQLTNSLNFSFVSFIIRIIVTAIVPNLLFLFIFRKTKEFQHLYEVIKPRIMKSMNKRVNKQDR